MSNPILFRPRQGGQPSLRRDFPIRLVVLPSSGDLSHIFRLRYRAYFDAGYIPADPSGQYSDTADTAPTTIHLAAYLKDECVGAMRVTFSQGGSGAPLPCSPYYPEVARMAREPHRRLVEISRLAVEPALTNLSLRTTMYACLVRSALMAAETGGATDILIATKPEWVRFYRLMLGCHQVGQPANYPPGDFKITLLTLTMEEARRRQRLQNRFFKLASVELQSMREAFSSMLSGGEIAANDAGVEIALN